MADANMETAIATTTLLRAALERGDRDAALIYVDRIQSLLLRGEVLDLGTFNPNPPGSLIGESTRYSHLGTVLAEKRRLAEAVK